MSDRVSRFKKRQKRRKSIQENNGLSLVADQDRVEFFLNQNDDDSERIAQENAKLNSFSIDFDLTVDIDEVEKLLKELSDSYNSQKFEILLSDCKKDVLKSIVGPFGLGAFVGKFDKDGGNVDTVHNARSGVYASSKEQQAYENREVYDSSKYHGHKAYRRKNKSDSELQKSGQLNDAYTGNNLGSGDKRNLDHTVAASEIHNDPGRVLSELNGPDLANIDSNLNSTAESINNKGCKGALTVEETIAKLKITSEKRQNRIKELSQKNKITQEEKKELKKLQERESVDEEKMLEQDEKARKEIDGKINRSYYGSEKFAKNLAKTSAKEGAKMGIQQALGTLITEFFVATFDEIQDLYKKGLSKDGFLADLEVRLKRVAKRIGSKWKDAMIAFKDGFISGFLSNLVTTVINAFVTTGARLVRMIREGFFSLLKAVKLLCFPPEGMTRVQAAHEASKLIAGGLVIIGGVALEEYIDKQIRLVPGLELIADIVTGVLVGSVTAIATTFVVYLIDKMDFFKVNDNDRHDFIIKKLNESIESSESNIENLLEDFAIS